VGKSTTAVNLALALQAEGARVGIIDADIYGPNQPLLLKTQGEKAVKTEQGLQPIVRYGLQTMSMGYLSDAETPIMWRGPMISQAVQQLTYETQWQDVDYLIMDLPPGTGDIQLTLAQKIPVAGTVMVTTPQTVATQDTRKGLEMMRKLNITLLGLIENMSYFRCSHCGEKEFIFGKRGALQLAQQTGCELVGSLPFERLIQVQTEQGEPIVSAVPESEAAQLYRQIARKIAAKLSLQAKNYADKFKVVVENKK
jgi:ATP-binding protein involved in chromosome partitioning